MDKSSIIIEEYKHLWSYYHRLLDERNNLLNWYFKIVGLPLGLVGYFLVQKNGQVTLSPEIGSLILILIFFVGLSLFGTYAKESSNAEKYHKAMVSIRKYINMNIEDFDGVIVIDELRNIKDKPLQLGSTAFWRIFPLVLINTGIAICALKLSGIIDYNLILLGTGIIVLAIHFILYKILYVTHQK